MIKWRDVIEATFRVFVRQHEDVQLHIDEIQTAIDATWMGKEGRVIYGELNDLFWPIAPEDADQCREKGYFLTEYDDRVCVVIRELPITINTEDVDTHIDVAYTLDKACGDKLATVRVIREKLAEFQAV